MRTETKRPGIGALLVLGACLALVCACGGKGEGVKDAGQDQPADQEKKPKIVAVQSAFDFGQVKQGVDVEHIYKIRNEGTAELKIEKARGS
jgi:hypothetical protein